MNVTTTKKLSSEIRKISADNSDFSVTANSGDCLFFYALKNNVHFILSISMSFNKISHVIWDFDGVLIDSEQVYSNVNQKMLSKYGKNFTLEIKVNYEKARSDYQSSNFDNFYLLKSD